MGDDHDRQPDTSTRRFHPVSKFVKRTGMHAVAAIASEEHRLWRTAWIGLTLAAVIMLCIQVASISVKLASRPTSTKVEVVLKDETDFPAVTFCNLNPVKRLEQISLTRHLRSRRIKNLGNKTLEADYRSLEEMNNLIQNTGVSEQKTTEIATRHRYLYLLNTLSDEAREQLTEIPLREMLIGCSFKGEDCNKANWFKRIRSPSYGNCYVFNSGDLTDTLTVRGSSIDDGLELTLLVDESSYLPHIAPALGYLVIIHPQTRPPIPEEEGFMLAPGFLTTFGLKMEEVYELEPPYGRCKRFTKADNRSLNMYVEELPRTQPDTGIFRRTCEQYLIMEALGCYSYIHGHENAPVFRSFSSITNARKKPCPPGKVNRDRTMKRAADACRRFRRFDACETINYQVSQSMAVWPDKTTEKILRRNANKLLNSTDVFRVLKGGEAMRSNFLKFQISFDDLSVTQYKSEPMYGWSDFLSDLGGQGGLWLGISIFTYCEVLLMLFELLLVMVSRGCQYLISKQRDKSTENQKDSREGKEDSEEAERK